MIFGTLSGDAAGRPPMTLAPPSPYAVLPPMQTHPAQCEPAAHWGRRRYGFGKHIAAVQDPAVVRRRATPQRGMAWVDYMGLRGAGARVTPATLAFFADCFMSYPLQLPTLADRNVCVT